MRVDDLLSKKDGSIWSVHPKELVFNAIKLMDEKGVGALVVLNDDKLVGIISERDYARKVVLKERSSKKTSVAEIMTGNVICASPDKEVSDCMVIMTEKNIRHLPVVKDSKVVGMISIGDVVKEIIREQQYTIENLENSLSWGETY